MLADTAWKLSREGDPAVAALFSRHYTCRRPDRQHRFGPGERLCC